MINCGTKASAGCIRLTVQDAKWIYDNIARGTSVEFYSDSNPGPLGKPTSQKISGNEANRGWDPTDQAEGNPWRISVSEDTNNNTNIEISKEPEQNTTNNTNQNTVVDNTISNNTVTNNTIIDNSTITNNTVNNVLNETTQNTTNENTTLQNNTVNNIANNANFIK